MTASIDLEPYDLPIEMRQGQWFTRLFFFQDETQAYMDMSTIYASVTMRINIQTSHSPALTITGTFTTGVVAGISHPCVKFDMPSASTALLRPGTYEYDMKFTYIGGVNSDYLFKGEITISEAETP